MFSAITHLFTPSLRKSLQSTRTSPGAGPLPKAAPRCGWGMWRCCMSPSQVHTSHHKDRFSRRDSPYYTRYRQHVYNTEGLEGTGLAES